ncbi:nuclear receptor 2C2-associated protein-like [Mytilus californianus]|uniref:nuclear receptor 2C2-associated protein-like n=1 Tax=Mytilus californianus TaxID=6549 RepID=UPI0022452209|nr:nuclear receptor 2C2-associated protein-like [Mytilus californianus]
MRKITNKNSKIRVSSVLNRDTKQFGKKYLVDEEDDTCWNSDQGSPQWIAVEFDQEEHIAEIRIKFQGGFAGRECWAESLDTSEKIIEFYPDDINSLQSFKLDKPQPVKKIKVIFNNSTDFFGRITIYQFDILGEG